MISREEFYEEVLPLEDDLLIILKGHLIIEELIEEIINRIVAHSEELNNVRLNFYLKVHLAKAMCWDKNESDMWGLILSLNTLRNDLAHNLATENRTQRIESLVAQFFESIDEVADEDTDLDRLGDQDYQTQFKFIIAYLIGFLESYLSDAKAYRKTIDNFYSILKSMNKNS